MHHGRSIRDRDRHGKSKVNNDPNGKPKRRAQVKVIDCSATARQRKRGKANDGAKDKALGQYRALRTPWKPIKDNVMVFLGAAKKNSGGNKVKREKRRYKVKTNVTSARAAHIDYSLLHTPLSIPPHYRESWEESGGKGISAFAVFAFSYYLLENETWLRPVIALLTTFILHIAVIFFQGPSVLSPALAALCSCID